MRKFLSICVMTFAAAALLSAAGATGKWVAEQKFTPPNGGDEITVTTTFDLKAEGDKLTGTVTSSGMGRGGGGEPRPVEISDGKIDGNSLVFYTVTTTQRGEMKWKYEATVDGDTLTGKRTREGGEGRGGRMGTGEFTAKRQ
jgi:hypothetical protein